MFNNKAILLVLILLLLVAVYSFVVILPAYALTDAEPGGEQPSGGEQPHSQQDCCPEDETKICICNPLGEQKTDLTVAVARISQAIILPIGAIAFLFFIIGGFYWIFSGGNDEKVKQGKDIIVWSLVGLLIIFSAYAILRFVFKALGV